ncbi:MAG: hypothetical protein MI702_05010, partial [Chlorobiales bacterium]|nr:hypothetical protein [Chlorobiales bacterium]
MTGTHDNGSLALMTDLYELTMAASYFDHGRNGRATFSLFIRDYPPHRGYFVAAGLADLVDYLERFRFTSSDIDYLCRTGLFKDDFRDYLKELVWDRVSRLESMGTLYFSCQGSEYVRKAFRLWMISAVARIMVPGVQCDNVLILEGE